MRLIAGITLQAGLVVLLLCSVSNAMADGFVQLTDLSGGPVWVNPSESTCVRTPAVEKQARTEICTQDSHPTLVREPPERVAALLGMKVFFHTPVGGQKVWVNAHEISTVRKPALGNAHPNTRSEACTHDTRCLWFAENPAEVAEKLSAVLRAEPE